MIPDTPVRSSSPGVRRLWLVRHGVTDWNQELRFCGHSDIVLNATGIMQASWVGSQLQSEPLAAVYTSDLLRAQQTAQYIVDQSPYSPSLTVVPAFRETSFGVWEGLTYAEIAAAYPEELAFFNDPDRYTPPGGEAFAALVARVQQGFADLLEACCADDFPTGDIVLVSHGGPLRVLICTLLGIPLARQWQVRYNHGSLSALEFVPTAPDILQTVTLVLSNLHPAHFSAQNIL